MLCVGLSGSLVTFRARIREEVGSHPAPACVVGAILKSPFANNQLSVVLETMHYVICFFFIVGSWTIEAWHTFCYGFQGKQVSAAIIITVFFAKITEHEANLIPDFQRIQRWRMKTSELLQSGRHWELNLQLANWLWFLNKLYFLIFYLSLHTYCHEATFYYSITWFFTVTGLLMPYASMPNYYISWMYEVFSRLMLWTKF
jgi:hypothetical protein